MKQVFIFSSSFPTFIKHTYIACIRIYCQNQRRHLLAPIIQRDQAEELMYVKSVIPHTILGKILTNMFVIAIQIEK
jgi:hypothetical protein